MKLETPMSAMRRRAVTLLWAVLVLPLASCLELESRTCSEELTCPSGMRCSADGSACISTPCGNSILEVDEQCDDGNLRDGDGCSKDCRSTEVCGNLEQDTGEACDDGNRMDGDGCSADCKSKEKCGNGIVDSAVGEVCDKGDTVDGDGCSADCRSDERCGNKVTDAAIGEVCDEGDTEDGDGCSADCRSGESCGNSIRDAYEDCDDKGESVRCNSNCTFSFCGDGVKNATAGEQCDELGGSAGCNSNCTFSVCGDGIVNTRAGEQCDTRGESATCNASCTVARCGDGIPNATAGEECDEGSANGQGNCLANCKFNACGDRVHQSWEACDDGNANACGTCGSSCQEYRFTQATGSIIAVGRDSLKDGETFSLNDGVNSRKIFEFDKADDPGNVGSGRIRVPIKDATSPSDVAGAIIAAINTTSELSIFAERGLSPSMVILTNVTAPRVGAFGNQRITENVENGGFKENGMSGGGASDCPAGMGCMYGEDCASGNCTNGVCQQ